MLLYFVIYLNKFCVSLLILLTCTLLHSQVLSVVITAFLTLLSFTLLLYLSNFTPFLSLLISTPELLTQLYPITQFDSITRITLFHSIIHLIRLYHITHFTHTLLRCTLLHWATIVRC